VSLLTSRSHLAEVTLSAIGAIESTNVNVKKLKLQDFKLLTYSFYR